MYPSISMDASEIDEHNFRILFRLGEQSTAIRSPFQKSMVKSILSECQDQLFILRNLNGENALTFSDEGVKYHSIEERYVGVEDHAEFRINSKSNSYDKLANDINMLMNVLAISLQEIELDGNYHHLRRSIEALKKMHDDEKLLLEAKAENEKSIEILTNQCEEERLCNIQTIDETNSKIEKLKFDVEDAIVYGKYELKYYDDWERTRREQNEMTCNYKEQEQRDIIRDMNEKIDKENRCHNEMDNFIEENKTDIQEEIKYWSKRYDDETDKYEIDTLTLRNDLEKLTTDLEAQKIADEIRQKEIDEWLEYKRKKKEKEEREQLEIWAATVIQAWWRGVMFRKKLGPYRKKKKGKGKDKKGSKKKKKK